MDRKKILIMAFALTIVAQIYVPISMIAESEDILEGRPYKFRTAPIDPNDPFRGKYITLSFKENFCIVADKKEWLPGEEVYGILAERHGFAFIQSLEKGKPNIENYLHLKVRFQDDFDSLNKVYFDLPFDKYYMEETKALAAEQIYRERQLDTVRTTYAIVYIKDGKGRLTDVKIGDSSIRDMVK